MIEPMHKQLGTTDSVNTCDCCGKSNLKFTWAVETESGEILHYGSTCVTKHTGKTPAVITNELAKQAEALKADREREFNRTAEAIALEVKMAEAHKLDLCGKAFYDHCTAEREAADAKRKEIFV